MQENGKEPGERWCPNCHCKTFTEQADGSFVCRNFRVPADDSAITYGQEYSSGDVEELSYVCNHCGTIFQAKDEESFREELRILNKLFTENPVFAQHDSQIIEVTCDEYLSDGRIRVILPGVHRPTANKYLCQLFCDYSAAVESMEAVIDLEYEIAKKKAKESAEKLAHLERIKKELESANGSISSTGA